MRSNHRQSTTAPLSLPAVLAFLLLAGLWVWGGTALVPRIIEASYAGDSIPLLNTLITGRDAHPLSYYLQAWHQAWIQVSLGALACVGLVLLTLPRIARQFLTAFLPSPFPAEWRVSRSRKMLVVAMGSALLAIQLLETLFMREHWPFSNYPMYSVPQGPITSRTRLVGVDTAGALLELDAGSQFAPFDDSRLSVAIESFLYDGTLDQQHSATVGLLELYEKRRREGRHSGPPLTGLRLERRYWTMDYGLKNRQVPDSTHTLVSYDRTRLAYP